MVSTLAKIFKRDRGDSSDVSHYLTLTQLLDRPQPYKELNRLQDPAITQLPDNDILLRIQGSLIGLAIGDTVGASSEFRPYSYMQEHRVTDMNGGGTWGLEKGQWTDDTSMALCLAASLIVKNGFDGYDQMVRYKKWFRKGYLSSIDNCFDIGKSTREALIQFEQRQHDCVKRQKLFKSIDPQDFDDIIKKHGLEAEINPCCGLETSAGNGSLMRLAPIPLFYWRSEEKAIRQAQTSGILTHDDPRARDACRFYAALIHRAIHGVSKVDLLNPDKFQSTFKPELHPDIQTILKGSYKTKRGYDDGIRGTGYVGQSLEAALWAFFNDDNSFKTGVLLAVNLGDDTDTTAAIYGQLAGAFYGIKQISNQWQQDLFHRDFILLLANGLYLCGRDVKDETPSPSTTPEILTTPIDDNTKDRRPRTSTVGTVKPPRLINEN